MCEWWCVDYMMYNIIWFINYIRCNIDRLLHVNTMNESICIYYAIYAIHYMIMIYVICDVYSFAEDDGTLESIISSILHQFSLLRIMKILWGATIFSTHTPENTIQNFINPRKCDDCIYKTNYVYCTVWYRCRWQVLDQQQKK